MNPLERTVRLVDRAQQGTGPLAFAFAVFKKFGDDRGATLASQLAYYGFLALFPALLVATTLIGFLGNERAADSLVGSVLGTLPVFDEHIGADAVRPLDGNWFGLLVGLAGLTYGALGVAQSAQHAMAQVWNVPGVVRPGFFPRLGRSVAFLLTVAVGSVAMAFAGSVGPVPAALALQVVVTTTLFVVAFRLLTPRSVATRDLVLGAVVAGTGYALLVRLGASLVRHQLDRNADLYGQFALVLGLLGWLNLIAVVSLYAAEANVVLARRLWPRSIVQPPLTGADERVLGDLARQEERRPEQAVRVGFDDGDGAGGGPQPRSAGP